MRNESIGERPARRAASLDGAPAIAPREATACLLRLYVTGLSRASRPAIERVREICERELQRRYELEIVDIYQCPALAKQDQIVATPTLIRVLPLPLKRYIGNMSKQNLIFGLVRDTS